MVLSDMHIPLPAPLMPQLRLMLRYRLWGCCLLGCWILVDTLRVLTLGGLAPRVVALGVLAVGVVTLVCLMSPQPWSRHSLTLLSGSDGA